MGFYAFADIQPLFHTIIQKTAGRGMPQLSETKHPSDWRFDCYERDASDEQGAGKQSGQPKEKADTPARATAKDAALKKRETGRGSLLKVRGIQPPSKKGLGGQWPAWETETPLQTGWRFCMYGRISPVCCFGSIFSDWDRSMVDLPAGTLRCTIRLA
jgi:hypothetical protein